MMRPRSILNASVSAGWRVSAWLCALLLLTTSTSWANDAAQQARQEFERGYVLAQEGDLQGSIEAFERAYALSPHYSVLYNLAQAYAAAGQSVSVVETLQRYLDLGADTVGEQRRSQVESQIAYHQRRIATLDLSVQPPGAEVLLDGKPFGTAPFSEPVPVVAGTHAVTVRAEGHASVTRSVHLVARQTTKLSIALDRAAQPAELVVLCPIPDVEIWVGARMLGRTPDKMRIPLPSGTHDVHLKRAGYLNTPTRVSLDQGEIGRIDCQLQRDPAFTATARLEVRHPSGTKVQVDGSPYRGEALPHGRHLVAVVGEGFRPTHRLVALEEGKTRSIDVAPRWTSERHAQDDTRRAARQRLAAYLLGGTGVASGIAAVVLYVTNSDRHDAWQEQSDALVRRMRDDPTSVSPQELDDLLQEENAIRDRDTLALGFGVFATTLVATSVALYLTADPDSSSLRVTTGNATLLHYEQRW